MITLLLQIYSLWLEIMMFMFVKLIEMCARRMIQQNKEFERSCFCAEEGRKP